MFENIAAIDVGSSSIKLVTVRTGLRDFQLKTFTYEDIFSTDDNPQTAVADAIRRVLSEEDLTGYKVITNLPMEHAILRTISFPFNDVEKIADVIPYEAEENIPFRLDELILDFQSLRSMKEAEGRILLAAVHKKVLHEFIQTLAETGIKPFSMGMESNALYECYRYFNRIENEAVIQIDIGHSKTIINFIDANSLLYTRSVPIGVGGIIKIIAQTLKTNKNESAVILHQLNIDLTSYENNIHREHYRTIGITRPQLKKIYTATRRRIDDLVEQIILTMKAMQVECGEIQFNRVLISGGGSNIAGIGTIISREIDLPVDALPFLEEYRERNIRTQFPIAFGTVIAYLNRRRSSINFLKGEFIPDLAAQSRKIYYLSGIFAGMALFVLLINVILTAVLTARSNRQYHKLLEEQFRSYFHSANVSDDPIADAQKLLKKEKKELDAITRVLPDNTSFLDILKDIATQLPRESGFMLNNLVYNEHVMMIEGTAVSSTAIDAYKENLIKSKRFESVTLNIKYSRQNEVRFSLTIKYKSQPTKE